MIEVSTANCPSQSSEHIRFWNDTNYRDMQFSIQNSGAKALHISHYNHETKDKRKYFNNSYSSSDLEKICQNILYELGFSCILEKEIVF